MKSEQRRARRRPRRSRHCLYCQLDPADMDLGIGGYDPVYYILTRLWQGKCLSPAQLNESTRTLFELFVVHEASHVASPRQQ